MIHSTMPHRHAPFEAGPRRVDPVQGLGLLLIGLTTLIPRPTFPGPTEVLAPAISVLLLFLGLVYSGLAQRDQNRVFGSGAFIGLVAATVWYGARVIYEADGTEYNFVISRVLLIAAVVGTCLVTTPASFNRALRVYAWCFVGLAALVGFIGLTHMAFLEPPLPARTLGITFPWSKTAGVPRSFGEQGIFIAIALAYALIYKDRLSPTLKLLLWGGIVTTVAMGQSRNIYLGVAAVLAAYGLIIGGRWIGLRILLLASGLATFVIELVLPFVQNTTLGRSVIGEGIYQENVEVRFTLVGGALKMISRDPFGALVGWQHADWKLQSPTDAEVGVHNHIASSLLFLGLIAGTITLWALFVRPLSSVLANLHDPDSDTAQRNRFFATAAAGILVSINFYEGFYSLALAIFVGWTWRFMIDARGTPQ